MTKWLGRGTLTSSRFSGVLLLGILALFVTFAKAAYQSYFSDDDFSNLSVAEFVPWMAFLKAIFSLAYVPNVRPLGLLFYKVMGAAAHFHFGAYLAVLQTIHVATSGLLWLFLRRLGMRPVGAALGCLFFALNAATLPAYWKPMYIFDVLCGFWVILSLVFYQRGRFAFSFFCAWLAFRSKEMELMLPLLLLAYEWFFAQKREGWWKPLIPFFVMSLSFGVQGLLIPPGPESAYSMHLTPAAVWSGLLYYGSKVLYAPLSGLVISAGLLFLRRRAVTFGVIGFWTILFPMLLFPGRQAGAYLYVPLLAFALAIADLAEWRRGCAAVFMLIWIPATYEELRIERRPVLAFGYEHRPYVAQVLAALKEHPATTAVVFEGTPLDFAIWGQEGLFTYALGKYGLVIRSSADPDADNTVRSPGALLLTWDWTEHKLLASAYPGPDRELSYLDFETDNPIWQLKRGWKPVAGGCRFTGPAAVVELRVPQGRTAFQIRLKAKPGQTVQVFSGSESVGRHRLDADGPQTVTWPVSSAQAQLKEFTIAADPPVRVAPDSEPLGLVVCACGFVKP